MMILGDTFALSHAEFAVPERFDYIYDPAEAMESFRAVEQQFLFCGHTHFPGTIRLLPDGHPDYRKPADFKMEEGFRYLVNVGSVGDPRNGDTHASYVIYDLDQESVAFRNVPFDIEAYRLDIEWAGIPTKPVLFDYADALTPVEAVTQVREFHVDEDAVARATAAEDAVGLQRIDSSGLQSRRKLVVSAGTMGDEISFRSSSAGRYHKSDRKRLAVTLGICVGSLLIVGIALAWSALNRGAPVPTLKGVGPVKPERPMAPERPKPQPEPAPEIVPVAPVLSTFRVLPWGSVWAYLDDGTDKGSDWREPGFDDRSWKRGPAELGYGEEDQATKLNYGPDEKNKYATTYFRTRFSVGNAAALKNAEIRLLRDDAAAIYLNGRKLYRDPTLAAGARFDTFAKETLKEEDEEVLIPIGPGFLLDGENTIAVEVHQGSKTSSDIAFNLELSADVPPDGGVIAQPDAGSRVDDKIIASTREDFDLIKQGFLAPDFDPSGAIQSLQTMVKKVARTTLEADIQRVIKELNAQVEQGMADVMRTLEAREAPLVNAGNYGEAVDLYDDYVGSFKAETIALRHTRAVALKNQATVATQELRRMHKKLNLHLHETFVEDLLDQRFDAVFKARSAVELEYPALAATTAFKALAKEVDELKKVRGLVQSKHPSLKTDTSDSVTFYKGVVLTASSTPEKARPFLEKVDQFQLAKSMASRLDLVLQEREEAAVHARMVEFRSRLGVPADLTDPAKIRERIFARTISGVALKSHRNQAVEARKRYGQSPAFKQHESFIKVLETMRAPAIIRPFPKALGVMSMASNRIKRIGEKKWGMLSEGLKRSVGVISGSPQVNSSEGGKLFTFTGSNHITFKDGIGIKENSDWTVTFWANPEPGQADGSMIVLGVWGRDNTSCLMGIKGSKFHLAAPNKQKTGGVVKANTWQHHVITHKGPRTTWLVDSKEIISLDHPLNLNNYLILGGRMDSAGAVKQRYKGQLKDIHIYNRIFRPDEIKQLNAAVLSTL
jgi:diadenosine tetraphosphatase ApaH/serine/threonine PP2A family protein phosphatase